MQGGGPVRAAPHGTPAQRYPARRTTRPSAATTCTAPRQMSSPPGECDRVIARSRALPPAVAGGSA